MGGPDLDRNARVKFTKRSKTLKRKAHELAESCDADVYLFIAHPREYYAYNSADDNSWPPPDEVLVKMTRLNTKIKELKYRQELHYPNLERNNFSEMQRLQESSSDDLKRLCQYFATRGKLLQSLDNHDEDTDSAPNVREEGALENVPQENN